jgi:hypothetical protein
VRIDLASFGTHGCPRHIQVSKWASKTYIVESQEPCGTCDREGSTLWIGSALAAHRSEIDAMPETNVLT